MVSHNDITGDALTSKSNNQKFRDNFDKIFQKPKENKPTLKKDLKREGTNSL